MTTHLTPINREDNVLRDVSSSQVPGKLPGTWKTVYVREWA
ncbi:MAG: hypothetical protein PUK59_06235 [Actinomycetaceae bacterium]|nr:hypothetical protein [Actinomycetaceae bacterium]MDY5855111.1 hypothetical protein [Arcanobacterium sp.]